MKWFKDIENLEELRKTYRKLVVRHHPDNGGSEDDIKEINNEYDTIFKQMKDGFEHSDTYSNATDKQKQSYDWEKDAQIRDMIIKLSRFKGITIEIIGVWIWVSECYQYRKELKEMGFRWASKKQMWYIHFDSYHKFSSKPIPMSHIRAKYGSVVVHTTVHREQKEKNKIKG